MLEKVRKEWQSYTGKIFEDIVRELLVEKMISDYPELGSWWNRKGDEIDILGIDHQERKAWQLRSRIENWAKARPERSWS